MVKVICGLPLAAGMAALMAAMPASALDATTLRATYAISIGGIVVGHAQAESRFTATGYEAAITGSTSGMTRMVTDASARLSGNGRISGTKVLPTSYALRTVENGLFTQVRMAMRAGTIVDLVAEPTLSQAVDRVPIKQSHKTQISDPISAFLIPLDRPGLPVGRLVCNRTVKVFDGWTRFDVQLFYKETKAVDGSAGAYAGRVVVCGARYIPVAGHRSSRPSVKEMADNRRLEVWLVQVKDRPFMVPYRFLIGTEIGDLVVYATRFSTAPDQRAALQ
jgi:hypothetical protein